MWAANEYDKLADYDAPTGLQPTAAFACHATPEHLCHGWAVVHSNRGNDCELLALRIAEVIADALIEIPEPFVPLFASGTEAAEHGKRDIEHPDEEAIAMAARLQDKYERLRT